VQRVQRQFPPVLRFQHGLNSADSGAVRPQRPSGGNQSLFCFIGHEPAIVADTKAKREFTSEIPVALALIPLHLRNALTDAVALGLGHRGENSEHQLADAVARHVAAQVDHVQADVSGLELREPVQRVETSEEAAFRYGAPLNRLLDRGQSRNRIKIADTTTAFWADASGVGEEAAEAADAFFGGWLNPPTTESGPKGLDHDQSEAAKLWDALRNIADGRPLKEIDPRLDEGVRLQVLGLAPNTARLVIRYWVEDRLDSFASRLFQHYNDIDIDPKPWRTGLPAAQRLLLQTVVPTKLANHLLALVPGFDQWLNCCHFIKPPDRRYDVLD
jgi:hypothetical protein